MNIYRSERNMDLREVDALSPFMNIAAQQSLRTIHHAQLLCCPHKVRALQAEHVHLHWIKAPWSIWSHEQTKIKKMLAESQDLCVLLLQTP